MQLVPIVGMSQILLAGGRKDESVLFQDLFFAQRKESIETTVSEATCAICAKGLDEGISITATLTDSKMKLFCQYHMPRK